MVGAPPFSQPILWIQPTLQSLPRNSSSSSVNFHFPILPLVVQKSSLQSPLTLPSYITQKFFTSPFLRTTIPTICTKNVSLTSNILPIQDMSKDHVVREYCEDWNCFNISFFLKVWTVIAGLTHNHWFFIAQTQKIDTL